VVNDNLNGAGVGVDASKWCHRDSGTAHRATRHCGSGSCLRGYSVLGSDPCLAPLAVILMAMPAVPAIKGLELDHALTERRVSMVKLQSPARTQGAGHLGSNHSFACHGVVQ
jgi:hypothetical protein